MSLRHTATVVGLLDERSSGHPAGPFVECGGERRTYGEMAAAMQATAAALAAVGVRPGDRVAVLLPNRIEAVELFFGCARLGAVQVPLNVFLKGEFLRYQLADCGAQTIVLDADRLAALEPLLGHLPDLRRIVTVGGVDRPARVTREIIVYDALLAARPGRTLPPAPSAPDLCSILYTSGTTGMPKGCMVTHGYLVHSGEVFADSLMGGLRPDDVFFSTMPLFHITGMAGGVLTPLVKGISAAVEPHFSASAFCGRLIETGATVTMGTGSMAHALLSTAPSPVDRGHRLRLAAFAPLPAPACRAFTERFGVAVGTLGYGQTECFPVTIDVPLAGSGDAAEGGTASAGRPVPWLQVCIVDDRDTEVPRGTVGEIAVRPKEPNTMFSGYWQKPEETVNAFRNLWHHTGDLGRMDEDGLVRFIDRKKDAIRRRGENISSFELEAAISRHPAVLDVAVHAIPSPLGEDDVKAWLVLASGQRPDPGDLFRYFRETLPYFAIPRYVAVTTELPRNCTGKVQKEELRNRPILDDDVWDLEALGFAIRAR